MSRGYNFTQINSMPNPSGANAVEVLTPYVIKQGDTFNEIRVRLKRNNENVDFTGVSVAWSAAGTKGTVITERPVDIKEDGEVTFSFTEDDKGIHGTLRIEFKVTHNDTGQVEKFPANGHVQLHVTQSHDDLTHTPITFASIAYFNEQVEAAAKSAEEAKQHAQAVEERGDIAEQKGIIAEQKGEVAELAAQEANAAADRADEKVGYIEEKEPLIDKFTDDQTNLQAQVNQLVVDGDSSPESAQARVGADAKSYPTLKARLDAEQNKVATQLADKANQDDVRRDTSIQPINVSEMDTETKKLFTGGSVAVVGENAVGRENVKDKAIDPENTTFMRPSKNLFNGFYKRGWGLSASTGSQVIEIDDDSRMAIIPIQGGQNYKIRRVTPSSRFRIALFKEYPFVGARASASFSYEDDTGVNFHSIDADSDDRYLLVYVSIDREEPLLNVMVDEDSKEHIPPTPVIKALVEEKSIVDGSVNLNHLKFLKPTVNIFDGQYEEGVSINAWDKPRMISTPSAVSVTLPIDGGSVYYVRKFERSDRLRIGLASSTGRPAVGKDLTRKILDDNNALYCKVETNEDENFIVIGVSNSYEQPKMHVTKDIDYEDYLSYRELSKEAKEVFGRVKKTESAKTQRRKFFTLGNPTVYLSEHSTVNPTGKDLAYFKEGYDSIEDSPLVTTEIRGYDDLGNEIKSYTIEKPYPLAVYYSGYERYPLDYDKRNKMKIIIIGGVHGNEKTSQVGLMKFIKKLVEDTEDKNLEFIRNNIILKVIPLANPSGIDDNTRANHANADINRDFVSLRQKETRVIVDFVSENLDAIALLDFHDSGRTISFWPAEENQIYHDIFYAVMANINDYWTKDNPNINNPVGEIVINPTSTNSQTFAHELGMLGIIVESLRSTNSINSGIDFSWNAEAVKYGQDLLVNTILTIAKYYS